VNILRRFLTAAAMLAVVAGLPGGRAEAADMSRLGAWAIGHNLSPAALLYAQDAPQQNIDPPLGKAKTAAQALKVDIKPFPPKGKTGIETGSAVIQYLSKGNGRSTGEAIFKKYGRDQATLFEIAVKSNMASSCTSPATTTESPM
jgi:hypothetical protein